MKVQLLAQLVSERISELAPDKTRTTSLLAMSLLLTACGSSGGDSSNGASATTQPSDNESITIGIPIENDTTPSTPPSSSDDDSVTTPPAEPVTPVDPPAEPVTPVDPPAEPVTPVDPPAEPVTPVDPPAEPVTPADPPAEPVTPADPPAEPVTPADPPAEPVTPADPPAQPVAPVEPPAPVITSTLVTFDITVPVHVSDELQLDVFSGDNELQAAWVVDETWTVTDTLPANSVSELRVVFYDHFGSTTLATYDSTVETAEREAQDFTVNADEFDSTIWDNDGDEISNLDELIAGTDPDFAELVGAPNEPPGLTSVQYSGFDLELFWSRGTDDDGVVIGYDIFRDDEQITDRLDALSFYDGSVQPETDYTYDIYSVDNDGLRSRAATLLITTPEDTPVNGPANAASLTGGGSASWFISDGLTTTSGTGPSGSCSYSGGAGSGVGISDSRLPNNGDAFDLGSLMWVNGVQVGGFLRSATASTSNFASVPIANLQVHTEFHAISSLPVLRNLTSFTNDTSEDIFVVINWASNFGADSGNRIITTSSGDNTFAANDRWAITDDASDGSRDPANTTVFYGPDSPVSMSVFTNTSVFNCHGSEGLTARIDVTIPAGETRALMLFHGMSVTQDNARSLASMFDDTPTLASPLTEGLTEAQLLNVINWSY